MEPVTIGIILAIIAFAIIIYLNYKANKNETQVPEGGEAPEWFDPTVSKRWDLESTVIALFLSKFGETALGPSYIVAGQILRRTATSLWVKVLIFDSLYSGNVTKNATKLDREVFDKYSSYPFTEFYAEVRTSINALAV